MPGSVLQAKVMQATTCFHDGIPNAILQEANFVLHNPVAFHPPNSVLNADSDGGHTTIGRLFRRGEFPAARCFPGLEDRHPLLEDSLETLLLIPTTARWQGVARQLRQALIRRVAFTRVAQEAHMTYLSDHEEVFARVTLLLATVICLWLFGLGRAVDWPFRTIMPTRGVVDFLSGACLSNTAAHSAAVRAGSRSWSPKA
jgi:hypothetical protein